MLGDAAKQSVCSHLLSHWMLPPGAHLAPDSGGLPTDGCLQSGQPLGWSGRLWHGYHRPVTPQMFANRQQVLQTSCDLDLRRSVPML